MLNRNVLLDTNLFVLFVAGAAKADIVAQRKHKRLKIFTLQDFHLLAGLLSERSIVCLPNIASEAYSLLKQHGEPERGLLLRKFKEVVETIEERYISSMTATASEHFKYIGLTDAAILLGSYQCSILTADVGLHLAAERMGLSSVNFNHVREGLTV